MTPIRSIEALRAALRPRRMSGETIGLVPTMGYLHAGHMALVDRARAECGMVVVSIFVNPTQFGPNEDLSTYPRDLDADLALCVRHGVDFVFAPEVAEMYPEPMRTHVEVQGLSDILIGAFRPGHFRGVASVVAKLFNIVQPDRAFFGEKDFQQLAVIRRMARDLAFGVAIVGVPTVREPDGLALSSRNVRLSPADRAVAPVIARALEEAEVMVASGVRDGERVKRRVGECLGAEPRLGAVTVDLCDSDTLEPVTTLSARPAVLLVTARMSDILLIDQREICP